MVLHIESYQSRRDAARLEARHRAADIGVGLTSIHYRYSTGNSIQGDPYFLLGCGNYPIVGRFVKTNPASTQWRASIIWHDLKARPANCQSRIDS
jgi:hypothetical protein